MNEFTSIFFHVNTSYTNTFFLSFYFDIYIAMFSDWQIEL